MLMCPCVVTIGVLEETMSSAAWELGAKIQVTTQGWALSRVSARAPRHLKFSPLHPQSRGTVRAAELGFRLHI